MRETGTAAKLLDISPRISARLAVWPGDLPYRRESRSSFAAGDDLELGAMHTTLHVGAHVDAPSHMRQGGPDLAALPLELFLGPCQVLVARPAVGRRVRPQDLALPPQAPRVLVRTDSYPDPERWNDDFAGLAPELLASLHSAGVGLVGVDTPSADPWGENALIAHRRAAELGMVLLEGLVLRGVAAGLYTLVALPLRLAEAEASPVRAILIQGGASADQDNLPASHRIRQP